MLSGLTITRASKSRIGEVDFENLPFGAVFSDHMFSMSYSEGRWGDPRIEPYGPISLDPGTAMLHYGQTVFDGLKAFRGVDGAARVFRPERNAARLRESAARLCIPPVEEEVFIGAIRQLIELDHRWLPRQEGQALYIRPLLIGTEAHLDVRPDTTYRFLMMTAPVGAYFDQNSGGVSLKAEATYTRAAAKGGMGYAKTAGNYAAGMLATANARREGFDQVLWLDSEQHRFVEEVGAMNIFFKTAGAGGSGGSGGSVITPPLGGSILPGVTRDSVIALIRDRGLTVEERPIAIEEVMDGIAGGFIEEVFGAGTAAVIAPVERLEYLGRNETLKNVPGPLTLALYDEIVGIQTGRLPDRHGWNMIVPLPASEAAAPMAVSSG